MTPSRVGAAYYHNNVCSEIIAAHCRLLAGEILSRCFDLARRLVTIISCTRRIKENNNYKQPAAAGHPDTDVGVGGAARSGRCNCVSMCSAIHGQVNKDLGKHRPE